MVHSSPISNKQTSEQIFNFEVSIDLQNHIHLLYISLRREVRTPLYQDVSWKSISSHISVSKPL